jgi:hypothetical protein
MIELFWEGTVISSLPILRLYGSTSNENPQRTIERLDKRYPLQLPILLLLSGF